MFKVLKSDHKEKHDIKKVNKNVDRLLERLDGAFEEDAPKH